MKPAPLLGRSDGDEDLAPIAAGPIGQIDDCRDLCVALESCAAWTYREASAHDESLCTLHPAVSNVKRQTGCTTGYVRAGIARLPPELRGWPILKANMPPPPPLPRLSITSSKSLADVPVIRPGNCHRQSCLDVHHCALRWPENREGKFALVIADDLHRPKVAKRRGEKTRHLFNSTSQTAMLAALSMELYRKDKVHINFDQAACSVYIIRPSVYFIRPFAATGSSRICLRFFFIQNYPNSPFDLLFCDRMPCTFIECVVSL